MRICHVVTGLNTGGAETFLCRLLESLRPPEWEHRVVCLLGPGALSERAEAVASVQYLGMQRSRMLPSELWRLRRLLRAARPDVIHGWMYHSNLMATLAALGTGIPVIWGVRQSLDALRHERRNTRLVIRVSRILSRLPRSIIYNSSTGKQQHEAFGFSSARGMMIPNGYDTGRFRPDSEARKRIRQEFSIGADEFVIGLVARWHPMKDHDNFLRAAQQFLVIHPKTIFMLVGDGLSSDNKPLMGLLKTRDLTEKVRLCGRRADVPAINAALDVASSSSSWAEGFSNAIAEAMACAVPCVATDVGDAREIIGDCGVVVQPRDPATLCAAWEQLAEMISTERVRLGKCARERIARCYALPAIVEQYATAYNAVDTRA